MLEKGFLACSQFRPSFSHSLNETRKFLSATKEVFNKINSIGTEITEIYPQEDLAGQGFKRIMSL